MSRTRARLWEYIEGEVPHAQVRGWGRDLRRHSTMAGNLYNDLNNDLYKFYLYKRTAARAGGGPSMVWLLAKPARKPIVRLKLDSQETKVHRMGTGGRLRQAAWKMGLV